LIVPVSSGNPYFLVIDQGTSSTKCFLFDSNNEVVFTRRIKHQLLRPKPHHVECDALEIVNACDSLINQCVQFAEERSSVIQSAGLAVQRSTFLFWDKKTTKPLTPALSWQDSRAIAEVNQLSDQYHFVYKRSGAPLSEHFGGPKYLHLINNDQSLKEKTNRGEVWFGSLSTFLVHYLTGKASTDHSIAGRSLLLNIDTLQWDSELCSLFEVNATSLPQIHPTIDQYGTIGNSGISLNCVIGDQQAALVGQGGMKDNFLAMNFGTSGSVLMNSGAIPSYNEGLLNNILYSDSEEKHYLTEGSINACNAIFYWLEKELNISHDEMHWDKRCQRVEVNGALIPGFSGLAAPYWKSGFNAVYFNLNNASEDEIVRAAMESIGFLVSDILKRLNIQDHMPDIISASGGGGRPPLLQFIADLLSIPVGHSSMRDRTALGVYFLLKKYAGETVELTDNDLDKVYTPAMDDEVRKEKFKVWQSALGRIGLP